MERIVCHWLILALAVSVFRIAGRIVFNYVDARGEKFYRAGATIVETLDQIVRSSKKRQADRLEQFYSPGFHGQLLGLTRPTADADQGRDGICTFYFRARDGSQGPSAALGEWRTYLDSFDSILRSYASRFLEPRSV
jgi:hypothetical protein